MTIKIIFGKQKLELFNRVTARKSIGKEQHDQQA